MILSRTLYFTLLFFALIGCKQNDSISLTGHIVDGKTGGVVTNTEIVLSSNSISNGFYSNNFAEVDRTFANDAGMFEFDFEPGNAVEFEIRAIKSGMIQFVDTVSRDDWIRGGDNRFVIDMFRASQIDFSFQNRGSLNTILFTLDPRSDGCGNCCSKNAVAIRAGLDTVFTCQVFGNQIVSYELSVLDGSSSNIENGTIQVYDDVVPFVYK